MERKNPKRKRSLKPSTSGDDHNVGIPNNVPISWSKDRSAERNKQQDGKQPTGLAICRSRWRDNSDQITM